MAAYFSVSAAERVNHVGRSLGKLPVLKEPVLFNTPQADAILSAMQIMPLDSSWNENISSLPVLAESSVILARISADLGDRQMLRVFEEMNFVMVPDAQPLVPIRFASPEESDFNGGTTPVGAWPIPAITPIEGWPVARPKGESLIAWQRDPVVEDRHAIVVQPGKARIFETYQTHYTEQGWTADIGAIFSLDSNAPRPPKWSSADAAGLPMFPALIRYDEVQRGMIEHAMRLIVKRTRREFIYPATHYASTVPVGDPVEASCPAMGQRLRLKATFPVPKQWSAASKAVAEALKSYGAMVADNGNYFSVSCTPDERFPEGCFRDLMAITIKDFEIVATTGPKEGPRGPAGVKKRKQVK
jgi:hypothetical protein